MRNRKLFVGAVLALVLAALVVAVGVRGSGILALGSAGMVSARAATAGVITGDSPGTAQASSSASDPLILSYAAKFVCLEPLQPGQFYYGTVAPLVREATEVLIHNPNAFPVTVYKKAVRAPVEGSAAVAPGAWNRLVIEPDYAWRVDCDDIARLLTGNPSATFIGTYGIGVRVEGFVVVAIGPQAVSGTIKPAVLDVTAEYNKGSEVLKKDISYVPWWWYWWWDLPWRLGYPYQRILPITDPAYNIDCRGMLYDFLAGDVQRSMADKPQEALLTLQALEAGRNLDPTTVGQLAGETDPPALVALIGRCDKIDTTYMSVDYVLVSNKAPTDPDPREIGATSPAAATQIIAYPWIPGHWYDLTVVMPQNVTKDLDNYIREWHLQRWIDANPGVPATTLRAAMVYYFPWWCGWGWWYWWWGDDCVDIGVGEGESIDVEQITPTRVFMPVWPPVGAGQ